MAKRTSNTSKTTTKKAAAGASAPVEQPMVPPTKSEAAAKSSMSKTATAKEAKAVITRDMIAKRAYEIWERKGRPIGKDLENWQEAESELGVK